MLPSMQLIMLGILETARQLTIRSGSTNHTYTNFGNYNVRLTVTDINGCTDDTVVRVRSQPLVPNFTANDLEGCTPDFTTDFTNTSTGLTGITSSEWTITNEFGVPVFNTTLPGTGAPQDVPLPLAGIYTVTLTISGPGGCSETHYPNQLHKSWSFASPLAFDPS